MSRLIALTLLQGYKWISKSNKHRHITKLNIQKPDRDPFISSL